MAAPNLFEELKEALTKFKDFLHTNIGTIKPAIKSAEKIFPQVTELINKLIDLMGKLKIEIDKLNPDAVGAELTTVIEFTTSTKTLLESAKDLLPNEAGTINDVLSVVNVVSSLPSLDAIKEALKKLIDEIVIDLNSLK